MGEATDHGVARHALAAAATAPLVGLKDSAREHGTVSLESLAGDFEAEFVESAERGQVRAREGSVRQVEVFWMGGVGTSIIGRPRRLPGHRPRSSGYTPVPLPVVVEAALWLKVVGLVGAIAAVSVGMWLLWDDEVGVSGAGVVFGAGTALHWGLEQLTHRVRVTSSGFAVRSVFSDMESPMGAVREVRVDEDVALVIFDDESVLEVVPADGDGRALAAAIERAVESASRVPDGTLPHSGRPWTAFVYGAGAVALVATWLTHWLA